MKNSTLNKIGIITAIVWVLTLITLSIISYVANQPYVFAMIPLSLIIISPYMGCYEQMEQEKKGY